MTQSLCVSLCVCARAFSLQLSQLVIMTEDTEVEHAISGPVEAVHAAVANLVKVGGVREGVGGWGQSGEWWRFVRYGYSFCVVSD